MTDSMSAEEYNAQFAGRSPSAHNTEPHTKTDLREWLQATFGNTLEAEYRYVPERQFRADWCVPSRKLLIEYQGIMHNTVGHSSLAGILRDNEKANLAAVHGFILIYANAKNVDDGSVYQFIDAICDRQDDESFGVRNVKAPT